MNSRSLSSIVIYMELLTTGVPHIATRYRKHWTRKQYYKTVTSNVQSMAKNP